MIGAPVLVAAEGRNSPMREAAGIRCARWKYDHSAIVSTLRHERPHDYVAYEIFYPSGPFALLPMTDDADGHRSAIVWSVAPGCAGFLSLSDDDFAAEAEAAMGGFLGRIELLAPRSTYPLGFHHAARSPIIAWRWSATPRTASIRSPGRASISAIAMPPRWPRCWSRAPGSGHLGDSRPAIADPLPALAGPRHLHGQPGDRQPDPDLRHPRPDRVEGRRFGMGLINRIGPGQGPADGRGARHQRRPAAAASRLRGPADR